MPRWSSLAIVANGRLEADLERAFRSRHRGQRDRLGWLSRLCLSGSPHRGRVGQFRGERNYPHQPDALARVGGSPVGPVLSRIVPRFCLLRPLQARDEQNVGGGGGGMAASDTMAHLKSWARTAGLEPEPDCAFRCPYYGSCDTSAGGG